MFAWLRALGPFGSAPRLPANIFITSQNNNLIPPQQTKNTMKNTLHTPAPWKHAKRGDYDTHGIGIFANNEAGLPYYVATAGFMGTADHRYAEANARLIAAAPDLLNALKALMQRSAKDAEHYAPDGNEPIWAFISDASDAIAKADGR